MPARKVQTGDYNEPSPRGATKRQSSDHVPHHLSGKLVVGRTKGNKFDGVANEIHEVPDVRRQPDVTRIDNRNGGKVGRS